MLPGDKIFTRRLVLRKIEADDLPLHVAWSYSPEACGKYLSTERLQPEEARLNFEAGLLWNDQSRTFFITLRDGTPIGTILYWLRPEKKDTAVMALKIALPFLRDKGYGTEAQKFLIMYLFERMGLAAVEAYTDIGNRPQQRCLIKLGFELHASLQYDDQHIKRTGMLYRLTFDRYKGISLYRFHYE